GPSVHLYLAVDRDVLRVNVSTMPDVDVRVGHQRRTLASGESSFYLPLAGFKPGPNVITVVVSEGGKSVEEKAAFTAPEGPGAPFLQLHECPRVTEADIGADVRSGFGRINGCLTKNDTPFTVIASASPSAKVTVAGKALTAGADGELTLELDPRDGLLDMQV